MPQLALGMLAYCMPTYCMRSATPSCGIDRQGSSDTYGRSRVLPAALVRRMSQGSAGRRLASQAAPKGLRISRHALAPACAHRQRTEMGQVQKQLLPAAAVTCASAQSICWTSMRRFRQHLPGAHLMGVAHTAAAHLVMRCAAQPAQCAYLGQFHLLQRGTVDVGEHQAHPTTA